MSRRKHECQILPRGASHRHCQTERHRLILSKNIDVNNEFYTSDMRLSESFLDTMRLDTTSTCSTVLVHAACPPADLRPTRWLTCMRALLHRARLLAFKPLHSASTLHYALHCTRMSLPVSNDINTFCVCLGTRTRWHFATFTFKVAKQVGLRTLFHTNLVRNKNTVVRPDIAHCFTCALF